MPALLLYDIQSMAYQYGMKPVRGDSKNNVHLTYSGGERRVADGGRATGTLQVIGSNKSATKVVVLFPAVK